MGRLLRLRKLKRTSRGLRKAVRKFRHTPLPIQIALVAIAIALLWMPYSLFMSPQYTTDYTPLLNAIARGESSGNYNAYFGNVGNSNVAFTGMTIAQVLLWQQKYLKQGAPSDAVGKYQILSSTLRGLVLQLKLNPNTTYFDSVTQDKLAVALLERRGAEGYLSGDLSREQFAANLAQEWASLPKASGPNPQASYYAGDGLNQSRVSIAEEYQALDIIKSNRTLRH